MTSKISKDISINDVLIYKDPDNCKYGICTREGKKLGKPKYNRISNWSEGIGICENDRGKCGYINYLGKEISSCKYHSADKFSNGLGRVTIEKKDGTNSTCLITSNGNVLAEYLYITKIENEFVGYIEQISDGIPGLQSYEAITGLLNLKGEKILQIPFFLSKLSVFSEGLINVFNEKSYPFKPDSSKGGYMDSAGKMVIDFQFDDVMPFYNGMAGVKINNKYGFINKNGEIIISPEYDFIRNFSNNRAIVSKKGIQSTLIDTFGNKIFEIKKGTIRELYEGIYEVSENGLNYWINSQGEIMMPNKYETIEEIIPHPFFKGLQNDNIINQLVLLNRGNFYGLINLKGEILLSLSCNSIDFTYELNAYKTPEELIVKALKGNKENVLSFKFN